MEVRWNQLELQKDHRLAETQVGRDLLPLWQPSHKRVFFLLLLKQKAAASKQNWLPRRWTFLLLLRQLRWEFRLTAGFFKRKRKTTATLLSCSIFWKDKQSTRVLDMDFMKVWKNEADFGFLKISPAALKIKYTDVVLFLKKTTPIMHRFLGHLKGYDL